MALLNDLFGIQARGGCSCAGPYGHRLLGIDLTKSLESSNARSCAAAKGIKPGWVRVNFNYFISDAAFDYVVEAVNLLADEGWRLLPDYRFEPGTGLWRHRGHEGGRMLSLHDVSYASGRMAYPARHVTEPESVLPGYLRQARRIFDEAKTRMAGAEATCDTSVSPSFEELRWFPLPCEAIERLAES